MCYDDIPAIEVLENHWNPHKASVIPTECVIMRSSRFRAKTSCSDCCNTMTTSPGSTPGAWSTGTSRIFVSCTVFFPSQVLHRSFSLIISPSPLQSGQTDCICWTMPGPSCLIDTLTPRPEQVLQETTAPDLPPWPLHFLQITFFLICSFDVLPLNRSSRETLRGWSVSSPLAGLLLPPRPPIPPPIPMPPMP